jgi:hypothetical protein
MTPVAVNDSSNSYLWFNFTAGTHTIGIPVSITPEFPVTSLLLVLTGAMLVGAAVMTRFRKKPTIR